MLGSWLPRGQRTALSTSSKPTSCLGEKTERPLAGNGLLPAAPRLWGKTHGVGDSHIAGSPLLYPPPLPTPWSPGGDMGLLAVTANPTSPASLV